MLHAPHLRRREVRGLFERIRHQLDRERRRFAREQMGELEQRRDAAGVVVGAWERPRGVVVAPTAMRSPDSGPMRATTFRYCAPSVAQTWLETTAPVAASSAPIHTAVAARFAG